MSYTVNSYKLTKDLNIQTFKFSKVQRKKFPLKIDKVYLGWIENNYQYKTNALDFFPDSKILFKNKFILKFIFYFYFFKLHYNIKTTQK